MLIFPKIKEPISVKIVFLLKNFGNKWSVQGTNNGFYMWINQQTVISRAVLLFNKYDIKGIRMNDISNELGISKKKLYTFIKDKSELVEKAVLFIEHETQKRMESIIHKDFDAIDQLFEIVKEIITTAKDFNPAMEHDLRKFYPDTYLKIITLRRQFVYKVIINNIKQGKKEGLCRRGLNEEIIARLHLSGIERIPEDKVFSVEEYTSPRSFTEIFKYHIRGIANEKGTEILEKK